ncbi:MAG: 30S ribosome-binding factor RbfA [Patescibacteria group bacterium]|nr:30S ribosome-binding factor RbfA [Patescibacteria group bacterium]
MSERIIRLNELFKREISNILLKEESFDKNMLVTVTRVDISPELSGAKIFISVMPEEKRKEVLDFLKKDIYHIQQELNKRLYLKKIPRIVFYEESKVEEAARIEELISKIHKNDK